MAALIGAVSAELAAREIPLEGDAKRSAFRIHRDVRFSKNKSPYKTALGVVWYRQGSGKDGAGVLYFQLSPRDCFMGAAFYMPEPEVLACIRESIRVRPEQFLAVERALAARGLSMSGEDALSRMPRGFEDMKDSPVADALRLKNFVVRGRLSQDDVAGPGLVGKIADFAADGLPLLRFGWGAVDEVARAQLA